MSILRMSLDDQHFRENKNAMNASTSRAIPFRPIQPQQNTTRKNSKPFTFYLWLLVLLVGIPIILFVVGQQLSNIIAATNLTFTGNTAKSLFVPPELAVDQNGKTNVLMLGIDTRQKGPLELNTDTIILGSYDKKTNRFSMISFPRDITVIYPGRDYSGRINAAYAVGENKKKGSGLDTVKQAVEEISGQRIQYVGMVDLKGFTDLINTLGGIDVYVDTSFSGVYPTESLEYVRVSFKKGWNHMDGKTALQYSRMRKNVIPVSEGSDFGRARHQQKVIQAVLDKATKTETLLNVKKIFDIMGIVSSNIKLSKLTPEDVQAGITILKDKGKPTTFDYVLDLYAGGSVYRLIKEISFVPYNLGPVKGANKWGDVQNFIKEYFTEPSLVTMTKNITVYNAGDPDFTKKYNDLTKRFYFAKFAKGKGYPEGEGKVYAVGGNSYTLGAQFLATTLGLKFESDNTTLPVTVGKDVGIVVVFGKLVN